MGQMFMGEKERLVTMDRFQNSKAWRHCKCHKEGMHGTQTTIACATSECIGLLVCNTRLSTAVSVLPYYDISDEQEMFVLFVMSLATVKNI